jgi:hypothetical protein
MACCAMMRRAITTPAPMMAPMPVLDAAAAAATE